MGWNLTYEAQIHFRDDDGATTYTQLNYLEPGGARAHLAALLPLLATGSNCAVYAAKLSNRYLVSDTPPGVGADAHQQVVLLLRCDDDSLAVMAVPGVNPAVVLTSGPTAGVGIDLNHSAIAALVSALTTGIAGARPVSPTGHAFTALEAAYVGYDEGRW